MNTCTSTQLQVRRNLMNSKTLSRRDFLKLSGLGLAGMLAPPLNFILDDPFINQQGRVTTRTIWKCTMLI